MIDDAAPTPSRPGDVLQSASPAVVVPVPAPVSPAHSPHPASTTQNPTLPNTLGGLHVVRIAPDQRLLAAERIVGPGAGGPASRTAAARRFLESASQLGIDISLMWGTLDPSGRYFHQSCLAVVGAGRTAMLFLSSDDPDGPTSAAFVDPSLHVAPVPTDFGIRQRELLIRHACEHLTAMRTPPKSRGVTPRSDADPRIVVLVQGLLEPEESAAADALSRAGFLRLGDLAYMRRPLPSSVSRRRLQAAAQTTWPTGVVVRPLSQIDASMHDALLGRALQQSYIDTLDCPELCGLRDIDDVLESHRSVGEFDPALWWVIELNGKAEGAMLLSVCSAQQTVELVYLGISPLLRGRGLGTSLLNLGLAALVGKAEGSITCAVDTRNTPAMKLYKRAGFQRFSTRVPFVMQLQAV